MKGGGEPDEGQSISWGKCQLASCIPHLAMPGQAYYGKVTQCNHLWWNSSVHLHSLQLCLCSCFQQTNTFPVQGTHPLSQLNYPKHLRHFSISCQAHKTSLTSAGNEPDVLWQPQAGQQRESSHVSRSEQDLNLPLPERTGCVSQSDSHDFLTQERVNTETDVPRSISTGFLWKELFFVDLALPSGLRSCFAGTKSRKEFLIALISFKKCFPAHRKYLMGEGSFYITGHALQCVCTF